MQNFHISKMSVLELPSKISFLEDKILEYVESLCAKMEAFHSKFLLDSIKSQEILQTQLNSMFALNQIFKLWMQPQIVYGSYISISKAMFVSVGLDILKILTDVTYFIGPQKSCLQNHMRFVISLNCDLELEQFPSQY